MSVNFRIIGKLCFLLVIIGFFMPMGCDQNGFQLADSGMLDSLGAFAVYASFMGAIAGFSIGVLLLQKKKVPVLIDWIPTLLCFICIISTFYNIGYNQGYSEYFQSGVYMVLMGSILTLVFQLIDSYIGYTNSSNANHSSGGLKKCPFCANEIKREAIVCQFCGRDIPKEEPIVEQIEEEIIGNDNTEKIKLIVERENNVIYSAVSFNIIIDNKKAFSIENGSRVINFVNNGPHSIYASLDYNTQSEIINFNTVNPEIVFKLNVLGVGKVKLEKQKEI